MPAESPQPQPGPTQGTQTLNHAQPAATQDVAATKKEDGPRSATVNLPFVTAQFRAPQVHMPHVPTPHLGRQELSAAAHTARSFLPPPKQALYFAGLAVLAAVEVIEWPVAAAIGIGTAVMGRGQAQGKERPARETTGRETPEAPAAPVATPAETVRPEPAGAGATAPETAKPEPTPTAPPAAPATEAARAEPAGAEAAKPTPAAAPPPATETVSPEPAAPTAPATEPPPAATPPAPATEPKSAEPPGAPASGTTESGSQQ